LIAYTQVQRHGTKREVKEVRFFEDKKMKTIAGYGQNHVGIYDINKKRTALLHVIDFHAVLSSRKEGDLRIIKVGYNKFVGIKARLVQEFLELQRNNITGIDFVARAESKRIESVARRDVLNEIHQNCFAGQDS
jgi:hypothetical protein